MWLQDNFPFVFVAFTSFLLLWQDLASFIPIVFYCMMQHGNTALIDASCGGHRTNHAAVVEILLNAGANKEARNSVRVTCIHVFVSRHLHSARELQFMKAWTSCLNLPLAQMSLSISRFSHWVWTYAWPIKPLSFCCVYLSLLHCCV